MPMGVHGTINKGQLTLKAMIASLDGKNCIRRRKFLAQQKGVKFLVKILRKPYMKKGQTYCGCSHRGRNHKMTGMVYLIGAGPGDVKLITCKRSRMH